MWWGAVENLKFKTVPTIIDKINKLESDIDFILEKIIELEEHKMNENKMTNNATYAVYDEITGAFLSDIEYEEWDGFGFLSIIEISEDGTKTGHSYGSIERASFSSVKDALGFIDKFSASFGEEAYDWKFSVYRIRQGKEKIARFDDEIIEREIASVKKEASVENIRPLVEDKKQEITSGAYYSLKSQYERVLSRINKLEDDTRAAIEFADLSEDDKGAELIFKFCNDITDLIGE